MGRKSATLRIWLWGSIAAAVMGAFMLYPVGTSGANAVFAIDVLRWLLGEPEVAGPPTSEEDVPVRHTKKQDTFWFYASVFVAPGAVLLTGWAVTRRRRKREVKP